MTEKKSQTHCRILQLNNSVDPTMRFLGYEDFVRKFGQPDLRDYTVVFDGSLDTDDLEQIYTICREAPPAGYCGRKMGLGDIVELYNRSGSVFYYCDRIGFQAVDFNNQ